MATKFLVIILIVLVAMAVVINQGEDYQAFVDKSTRTRAVIVKKHERLPDPNKNRKEMIIVYRFEDPSGGTHTVETIVEYPDMWQRFREGEVVGVFYDPKNPGTSYLEPVLTRRMGVAKIVTDKKTGR
jgi:hypothetical protein